MQQIINFILRYKISLLYILFLTIALAFTVQSHSYHRSRYFNSANWLSGGIYNTTDRITSYFSLGKTNQQLLQENRRLRNLLYNKGQVADSLPLDSTQIIYK